MSSLINTKHNFIFEPNSLLMEVKNSLILDTAEVACVVEDFADQLFKDPLLGVYRPNDYNPLFTSHEKLYTHLTAYEFFPEIGSSVYSGSTASKYDGTIGKAITWREAVENPINVYNSSGRLVLRSKDSRNQFSFKPGPKIWINKFISDLTKVFIADLVLWGSPEKIIKDIQTYSLEDVDVENVVRKLLDNINKIPYFQSIEDFVTEDRWLIYQARNIGSNVIVDSSCDYRHYMCNQALWDKEHDIDPDDLPGGNFSSLAEQQGTVDYQDLNDLFSKIQTNTNIRIDSLSDFFELLESTKSDPALTHSILETVEMFLKSKKNQVTQSTKFINKIMKGNKVDQCFNINGSAGIYFC